MIEVRPRRGRLASRHSGSGDRLYDVRLRREITHRRLAVSLLRRTLRVLSLHVLDAGAVVLVAALFAWMWPGGAPAGEYTPAVVAIVLICLHAFAVYQPGDARRDRGRLAAAVLTALLILLVLAALPPALPLDVAYLAALGTGLWGALAAGRKGVDLLVRQAYAHGIGLRRAVVVGNLDEVGSALERLRDSRNIDQFVVGHLARDDADDPTAIGGVSQLAEVLDSFDVQEVVVAGPLPTAVLRAVAESCFDRGTTLYMLPSIDQAAGCRAEPCRVGSATLLRVHPRRLEVPTLLVKRTVDVVGAAAALLLLFPLIALIGIAIKLDSDGPVFFRQQRVGLGGQRFTMWKFRSMCLDAEARERDVAHLNIYGAGGVFKVRSDPRVTRIGRILRRSSMDELPQLVNVLFGEMSLVGPRPPVPSEVAVYEPHHFERLSVVPGITGPWQVGGRNLITDFEAIIRMERDYIQSWSIVLDLKILLRTVGVVIRGEGAY